MSFSFGTAKTATTASTTFGTSTPSTGFSFGNADPGKSVFGATANTQDNKPPPFNFPICSPLTTQGQTSAFGMSSGANQPSFGAPATSNAAQAPFGSVPFGAPPNKTVGSPGFGQPAQQAQATPFGMTSQQAASPTLGAQTTPQGTGIFSTPTQGFGAFGQPAATTAAASSTGFGFGLGSSTTAQQAAPAATTTAQAAPSGFGLFGSKPIVCFGSPAGVSAAPTFSTPAQQAQPAANTSFGADKPSLFGAPTVKPTGAFSFGPPAGAAGTTTQATGLNFSQAQPTQPTPQPTQPTTQPAQPTGLSFTTSQSTGLFGQTMFGSTPAKSASGGPATSQSTGLSFSATSTPASTGAAKAQAPGLFGAAPAAAPTSAPASTAAASQPAATSFGAPLSFSSKSSGIPFSTPAATSIPTPGLNFSTPSTAASSGINFSAAAGAPSAGPSFSAAPATSAGAALSFTTPSSAGLNFATKLPTSSAAPTSSAPSGITSLSKTTTVTMPSLIPTTTTAAAAPPVPPQEVVAISFANLEELINKWTLELEDVEKTFTTQATQINAWDRLLINNGEKIVELNNAVQSVKNEQKQLEFELDFVIGQQKEIELALEPLEKNLAENSGDRVRDPEREQMYSLAESLNTQLKQMSEDLTEVIENLNETNRGQDENDPITQIGRILNKHMSSMQWIDNSIEKIRTDINHLRETHQALRDENQTSFQNTYGDKLY